MSLLQEIRNEATRLDREIAEGTERRKLLDNLIKSLKSWDRPGFRAHHTINKPSMNIVRKAPTGKSIQTRRLQVGSQMDVATKVLARAGHDMKPAEIGKRMQEAGTKPSPNLAAILYKNSLRKSRVFRGKEGTYGLLEWKSAGVKKQAA